MLDFLRLSIPIGILFRRFSMFFVEAALEGNAVMHDVTAEAGALRLGEPAVAEEPPGLMLDWHAGGDPRPVVVNGTGPYLLREDGARLFDASAGLAMSALGNTLPADLAESVYQQIVRVPHATSQRVVTQPMIDLAQEIAAIAPADGLLGTRSSQATAPTRWRSRCRPRCDITSCGASPPGRRSSASITTSTAGRPGPSPLAAIAVTWPGWRRGCPARQWCCARPRSLLMTRTWQQHGTRWPR